MAEKVGATAKIPETKKTCSNSCKHDPSFNSSGSPTSRLLQLQRTAGNRAVQRLIKSGALQVKLRIGKPNDVYEQEADLVAEQTVNIPNSIMQCECSCNKNMKKILQAKKSTGQAALRQGQDVPNVVHEVISSPGQLLDPTARAIMEPRFGYDLSQVRVHTDDQAAKSVMGFNTRAYTVGNHIVFGSGQYSSMSYDGKELLFHELIHVVQNRGDARGISFWSREEHHILTQQVVDFYRNNQYSPSIMHDPLFGGEQFYQIVDASFNMDIKPKRLFYTGPRFLIKKVPIISPLGTKGEGTDHGEGGDYKLDLEKARKENLAAQDKYIKKSLDFYKKEKGQTRYFINKKIQITPNVEAMFKALGDACHIAQDRGAHWEGAANMGHDDERARKGSWDPDNSEDNPIGYKNAKKNTYDVFKEWAWEITMSIGYDGY